eukprot:scaffold13889_cov178-Amphora_coffeaeformis.AAC.11
MELVDVRQCRGKGDKKGKPDSFNGDFLVWGANIGIKSSAICGTYSHSPSGDGKARPKYTAYIETSPSCTRSQILQLCVLNIYSAWNLFPPSQRDPSHPRGALRLASKISFFVAIQHHPEEENYNSKKRRSSQIRYDSRAKPTILYLAYQSTATNKTNPSFLKRPKKAPFFFCSLSMRFSFLSLFLFFLTVVQATPSKPHQSTFSDLSRLSQRKAPGSSSATATLEQASQNL